jgi:dihydroorotase
MHVHLREPGDEDAETIESGTEAAARGGFTRIACMPNTNPPLDNRGLVEFVSRRASAVGRARVYPIAAATKGRKGEELTEMRELRDAGVLGVSDDGLPVSDSRMMRRLLEYAETWGLLVVSHAEDLSLSAGGIMHEGYWSTVLGLEGIPSAAEAVAVARDLRLAEMTGARVHIAHVSTREAADLIRAAKARGVRVTAETAPHYLALTDEALRGFDSVYRVNPPLRGEEDRAAIVAAVGDGTIDLVASDHAPHTEAAKDQELEAAPSGMIGLETSVGVVLEVLHHREGRPLKEIVRLFATRPAEIMNWGGGRVRMGEEAHLTVFDPAQAWTVEPGGFASKSRNCPFRGMQLRGRVRMAICDGRLTHQEDVEFCPAERMM